MDAKSPVQAEATWWRWVALPFAAIAGALAGSVALALLQWFGMKFQGGFSTDGWYFRYIMPLMSSAVFGWLYVLITLEVAPKGKVIAATVMTTVLGVFCVLGAILAWVLPNRTMGYAIQQTIGVAASLTTAIASIVSYKGDYRT